MSQLDDEVTRADRLVRDPRPAFDPDVARAFDVRDDIVTTLSHDDIFELRTRAITYSDAELTLDGRFDLTRHVVPGPDGNELDLVLIRPEGVENPPVIYHVHGGGLVLGTAVDVLPTMAVLADRIGAAVASIEYRLAPEHPYPAAVEDVYAGLTWLTAHAQELGVDAERTIIDGVSAGGGLAAAAALLARDRGGPPLLGQMLICPMLDDRNDSASGHQMAGHGAWDRTANATAWAAYIGDLEPDAVPMYASPARATDLSGLPPTFIDVGSAETFRDEDVAYASRIWAAGGDAELHVWPGGVHGFDALVPDAVLSRDAREARARWLERLLDPRRSNGLR
ncbi:alpha/beta hydrolase [Microbacterium sp. SLBN-146]|uniref:alpha/beta hydrolase n=1 Tax=Microbacterium sp. SLBN-146 TaxID=2768457 RepID=UPI001153E4FE|nr:alpha/beta hydrolase [Microbacterium sp. SLBN-146]TQJ31137.1 acetyl esterase/lipase [Microbacterium sp. SLBN-146]